MPCIKVEKRKANEAIRSLAAKNLIDASFSIMHDKSHVYIPVRERTEGYAYSRKRLKPRKTGPHNLSEALGAQGVKAKNALSSFDLLGNVAVVELPKGMDAGKVANAIMAVHRGVEAVYAKESGMEGKFRVRKFKLIGGKRKSIAKYRENGAAMEFDVKKVFFSPRLSTERKRIAMLARKNENVLVLFAGVGPFALCIAKERPSAKVIGIELNKEAVRWFRRNIALNRLGNVEAVLGDVKKELAKKEYAGWADRVVMPLPKDAEHFLKDAGKASKKGTKIHFYTFVDAKRPFEHAEEKIRANLSRKFKIDSIRKVRDYSPKIVQVVADIEVLG
jgi:tRNA (guanine37-N1)-methyltransferase